MDSRSDGCEELAAVTRRKPARKRARRGDSPPPPGVAAVVRLLESGDLPVAARPAAATASSSPLPLAAVLLHRPLPPRLGYCLHARAARSGLLADLYLANALLAFYVRLPGHLLHALRATMASGGCGADEGVAPSAHALSAAAKACAVLRDLRAGACVHRTIVVRGFGDDGIVLSALVDMYGHAGAPADARRAFEEMRAPDGICYTSLISAFVRNDWFKEALRWFCAMVATNGVWPDGCTFGSMMTALGNLKRARQGREAHAQVVTRGLCGNVIVESSTLDMYAKCGMMVDARKVFDRMKMDLEDDDWYSLGTLLRSCAGLSAVKLGKEIHCRFMRMRGCRDVIVESALVDLYAKCGAVEYAHRVFEMSSVRNMITWNAMICGFAQNGHGERAISLFNKMVREGVRPDCTSFIGVLFACSHTGMVEEGRNYFNSMTKDYGIAPGIEHYNCMVDLLSRVELLEEAEDLVNKSPFRDDSSLTIGRWEDAVEVRKLRKSRKDDPSVLPYRDFAVGDCSLLKLPYVITAADMDGPPLSPLAAMGLGSVHGQTRLSNWLHRLLGNGDRHSAIPRRLQDGPSSGAETMLPELELIAWCRI
ncbi:pentatricopeptide repeat-containing protein [Panicum miliaceum]|uniref:Pentatricopeptide repeat-containing protein n=1 Tax=Panicum miliaceum TaxID=4540 RepID=A0A3L6PGA1_PANMI|nr:pentatricopeptide repeat-containing protein [Panicum miliaceum]